MTAVGREMFRSAAQVLHGTGDLASLGVDGADALASAIGAENSLSERVVDNSIRVVSYPFFVQHRETLEIKHCD